MKHKISTWIWHFQTWVLINWAIGHPGQLHDCMLGIAEFA
jgi:hypothetical protein